MKTTEIDKVIKGYDNSLTMWQRLALADVWREEVNRVGDSYTLEEFLNDDSYGTLTDRAESAYELFHSACAPMSCLTCGSRG